MLVDPPKFWEYLNYPDRQLLESIAKVRELRLLDQVKARFGQKLTANQRETITFEMNRFWGEVKKVYLRRLPDEILP
jgi:hypothetical protein